MLTSRASLVPTSFAFGEAFVFTGWYSFARSLVRVPGAAVDP
jgi:hypothetical protein